MKVFPVLVVFIVLIVAVVGLCIAVYLHTIFNIHGSIDVGKRDYSVIDINLNITSPKGTRVLCNITMIRVENRSRIQFSVIDSEVSGDARIQLSGRAVLESSSGNYTIDMPCLLSKGIACYRIQMLILGYDAPLEIEPGTYSVTLILTWKAEGKGTFRITLELKQVEDNKEVVAEIIPIGNRPDEPIEDWAIANSSTRTYALLVDETEATHGSDGYGKIKAWIWMFQSTGCKSKTFKFQLIDQETNKVVVELEKLVEKHGMYYQILVLIRAKPGEYLFKAVYPTNIALEIPLKIQ